MDHKILDMEDHMKNIQTYLDYIGAKTKKQFRAKFEGSLAIVLEDGNIVFTSSGGLVPTRIQAVETFLGGIAHGIKISRDMFIWDR